MRRNNPNLKITDSERKEIRSSKDSIVIYNEDEEENLKENVKENAKENAMENAKGNAKEIEKEVEKESNAKYAENNKTKSINKVKSEYGKESFSSDENSHLLVEEKYEQNTSFQSKVESEILQSLKKEAINSFLEVKQDLLEQYLEFRNQVFKGQKSFRVVSQIATANLFLMGLLNCVFGLISISLLAVLISIYIMSISSVILLLEISKKRRIGNIETFVSTWFKFLQLSAGRGLVQILLCTISMYLTQSTYFSLMSLFVGFAGVMNTTFGILAASKLRRILNILRYYGSKDLEELGIHLNNEVHQSDLQNIKITKDQDPEYKLRKIHRFFSALDEDGNGQIDLDELYNGLQSLNFPFNISKSEIEVIFDHLDKDSDKMISIQEFENWFISKKCPYFIL